MIGTSNDIVQQEQITTLADITEEYMLEKQIFNEKFYPSYLKYAANAWSELFYDTLYIYNARWLKVNNVNGSYVVYFPKDYKGFISANLVDNCNQIQRIPLNTNTNTIQRPQLDENKISCNDYVSSFVSTTKYLFTNAGVDYYQTQYLQYCPNGDIIEKTVTPAKKYLDYVGDVGDYNNDYNNDYNRQIFGNFVIENQESQRVLVNLDTDEFGCIIESRSNIEKLIANCGCYSHFAFQNYKCDDVIFNSMSASCYGTVTLSENKRSLVYTPPSSLDSCAAQGVPEYILVYFKGSALGNEITGAVIIPDDWFIRNSLTLGTEYYSMRLNSKFSENEKVAARARFDQSINDIIRNKLDMSLSRLTNYMIYKTTW